MPLPHGFESTSALSLINKIDFLLLKSGLKLTFSLWLSSTWITSCILAWRLTIRASDSHFGVTMRHACVANLMMMVMMTLATMVIPYHFILWHTYKDFDDCMDVYYIANNFSHCLFMLKCFFVEITNIQAVFDPRPYSTILSSIFVFRERKGFEDAAEIFPPGYKVGQLLLRNANI